MRRGANGIRKKKKKKKKKAKRNYRSLYIYYILNFRVKLFFFTQFSILSRQYYLAVDNISSRSCGFVLDVASALNTGSYKRINRKRLLDFIKVNLKYPLAYLPAASDGGEFVSSAGRLKFDFKAKMAINLTRARVCWPDYFLHQHRFHYHTSKSIYRSDTFSFLIFKYTIKRIAKQTIFFSTTRESITLHKNFQFLDPRVYLRKKEIEGTRDRVPFEGQTEEVDEKKSAIAEFRSVRAGERVRRQDRLLLATYMVERGRTSRTFHGRSRRLRRLDLPRRAESTRLDLRKLSREKYDTFTDVTIHYEEILIVGYTVFFLLLHFPFSLLNFETANSMLTFFYFLFFLRAIKKSIRISSKVQERNLIPKIVIDHRNPVVPFEK
ncbi:hypothetical protein PUN28_018219 [Cardiocondyla obscurior]|uniref:Ribosomal protein S3 n=1 Tax=Cardiocondyla obscurior TaxID=286306 RepID=A0AAW2EKK5_9HYME